MDAMLSSKRLEFEEKESTSCLGLDTRYMQLLHDVILHEFGTRLFAETATGSLLLNNSTGLLIFMLRCCWLHPA